MSQPETSIFTDFTGTPWRCVCGNIIERCTCPPPPCEACQRREAMAHCSRCGGLGWIVLTDAHGTPIDTMPCPDGCRPDRWVPPVEMTEP